MAATLAFGTYIPGVTPVHKLNAQVKIILACVFSINVFMVQTWFGLGFLVLITSVFYALAKVSIKKAASGLKPIIFILVFTIVVHAFSINVYVPQAQGLSSVGSLGLTQKIVLWNTFGVTLDGFITGLFFALRISILIAICSLLTFTSSMIELTDALLKLMSPLRKIKIPVDDFAMMISIALRFIPTTATEAQNIVLAQKARCANFDTGSIITRIKAWVPVFIPLFVRLFRRADELANAMDARCYIGKGRTCARENKIRKSDIIIFFVILIHVEVICILL